MDKNDEKLARAASQLSAAAAQVGSEHARLTGAIAGEVAAKVRLLELVVEAVGPAREAIASKIHASTFRGLEVAKNSAGHKLWLLSERDRGTGYDFLTDNRIRPGIGLEWRSVADVAAEGHWWKLDEIVRSITKAVEANVGKREERTADTLERAKKLRAVADLLEGL